MFSITIKQMQVHPQLCLWIIQRSCITTKINLTYRIISIQTSVSNDTCNISALKLGGNCSMKICTQTTPKNVGCSFTSGIGPAQTTLPPHLPPSIDSQLQAEFSHIAAWWDISRNNKENQFLFELVSWSNSIGSITNAKAQHKEAGRARPWERGKQQDCQGLESTNRPLLASAGAPSLDPGALFKVGCTNFPSSHACAWLWSLLTQVNEECCDLRPVNRLCSLMLVLSPWSCWVITRLFLILVGPYPDL